MAEKKTYQVNAVCANCQQDKVVTCEFGTHATLATSEEVCEYCGCKVLHPAGRVTD